MPTVVVQGVLPAEVTIPDTVYALVARYADGAPVTPTWHNPYGGLTFRIDNADGEPSRYLKWVPEGATCPDPFLEAGRMSWVGRFAVVPQVLDVGRENNGAWLLTQALASTCAIDPRWQAQPHHAVHAIATGLRLLHDVAPAETCPFLWTPAARTAALPTDMAATIGLPPPTDHLVVCHGDATVPNTLLHDNGTFAAHVDLGELGVADRWSDLAVTSRSVVRRFGDPHLETEFFAAYGIAPDPERIHYYRRLWDVVENSRKHLPPCFAAHSRP